MYFIDAKIKDMTLVLYTSKRTKNMINYIDYDDKIAQEVYYVIHMA